MEPNFSGLEFLNAWSDEITLSIRQTIPAERGAEKKIEVRQAARPSPIHSVQSTEQSPSLQAKPSPSSTNRRISSTGAEQIIHSALQGRTRASSDQAAIARALESLAHRVRAKQKTPIHHPAPLPSHHPSKPSQGRKVSSPAQNGPSSDSAPKDTNPPKPEDFRLELPPRVEPQVKKDLYFKSGFVYTPILKDES